MKLNPDFLKRRQAVLDNLPKDAIALIPAALEQVRNGDAHHRYRQQSDFYYLTGLEEADAVLVFAPGYEAGEFIIFNRVKDKTKETWDGPLVGQQGAKELLGADVAYPIDEFPSHLLKLLKGRSKVYYDFNGHPTDQLLIDSVNKLRRMIRSGVVAPKEYLSFETLVHELRLIKSEFEIEKMRYAAKVSAQAHKRAMQACKPGLKEYHLAAELHYTFQKHGCFVPAYSSIVGAGKNACILHYINNNQELKEGDLVLIDAGGEYDNYAADITRTFPVNGVFNSEQKIIYELVLKSQLAAIEVVKPGVPWVKIQETIVRILTEGLVELGILQGNVDQLIKDKAYFQFYMHNSGHWLGLDVHDVGSYKVKGKWRELTEGMVLTIEPGLYISADHTEVDPKWHNIGVRIEDDILVTADGCEVLSKEVPKTIAEVEQLMQSAA